MVRNELSLAIPSYFKCPISLEVMKSPVSLSTGVTYDRSSIQPWLETGHTTCPATMQRLSSSSFVPNLTLLRLIKLWPSLSLPSPYEHSIASFRKLVSKTTSSNDESCRVLMNSKEFLESLREVCVQAKKSKEYCSVLEKCEGLFDDIVRLIMLFDRVSSKFESLEMMLVLLDLVVADFSTYKKLINCLPKFIFVMQNGTLESKVATTRILQKIVNFDGETNSVIIEEPRLILEAYSLVKCDDNSAIEAGLGLLIALAENSRPLIKELVRLGLVKRAGNILCDIGKSDKTLILRSMEVLEMAATCNEGRKAICKEEKVVEEVVKRLMKVSDKATEHGLTLLWSVCYKFRDEKIVEVVRKCNGVEKCLLLMQSNCNGIVRSMCVDLVKVLRGSGNKSCLASYDTKTTHIMAN